MQDRIQNEVTNQIIQMIQHPYADFESRYGTPSGLWQDEFVLGFFGIMIAMLIEAVGEDRISQNDMGYMTIAVFLGLAM